MRKGKCGAKSALRVALLAGTAMIATPATAATIAWNAGTGDWFTAGNWLPTQVPGANDTAIINNGGTALAGANVAVFTVAAGSAFDPNASVSGTAAFGANLTLTGELIVGRSFSAPGATAVGSTTVAGTLATAAPQSPRASPSGASVSGSAAAAAAR